jgi:CheY-like chemotaxis protein
MRATQVALTDPDARLMHQSSTQCGGSVAYNVQSLIDAKHKLIVAHDVTTDGSDQQQLTRMAVQAKQALGVEHLEVVARQGYYDGGEVAACEQAGIEPYIAKPQTSKNLKRGLFTKQDFIYDAPGDRYHCPGAQWLDYRGTQTDQGRRVKYYMTEACGACILRQRCTAGQGRRRIEALDRRRGTGADGRPDCRSARQARTAQGLGGASLRHSQACLEPWLLPAANAA